MDVGRIKSGARVALAGPAAHTARFARASQGLAAFVFHDVDGSPAPFSKAAGLSVSPRRFREQLAWITERFDVIDPDDLLEGRSVAPRAAVLTFDDGFHSIADVALPVLEELELPAVLFLNMGVANGEVNAAAAEHFAEIHSLGPSPAPGRHHWSAVTPRRTLEVLRAIDAADRRDELLAHQGRYLTGREIDALDGHPLLRFGNHLWNHWFGPALNCGELDEALRRNRDALERHRSTRPWFAFTFGVRSPRLERHAVEAGAARVFTGGGVLNPSPADSVLHRIDLSDRITSRRELLGALAIRTSGGAAVDSVADLHRCPDLDRPPAFGGSPRWSVIVTDAPSQEWLRRTARFFNGQFPGVHAPRSTPEMFQWKLSERNPAGRGLLALAVVDGEVVGTMTATMKRCVLGGVMRTAAEVGDTYTHPALRRAGTAAVRAPGTAGDHYLNKSIFGRLVSEVTAQLSDLGVELVFGTPNASSLPGYVGRGGYIELGASVRSWHRPAAELAGDTLLPSSVVRFLDRGLGRLARLGRRWPADLTIGDGHVAPEELDELWLRARSVEGIQLVQDAAFFEHRYVQHPDARYEFHAVRRRGALIAVVVIRELIRPNGRSTRAIADWLVDPTETTGLEWAIGDLAGRPGRHQTISLWTDGSVLSPIRCRSLAFIRSRAVPVIVAPTPLGLQIAATNLRIDLRMGWTDNV